MTQYQNEPLTLQPTEDLLRRKEGLENGAAAAMAEGGEVSSDIIQEIESLRAELERRGHGRTHTESPTAWIGRTLAGYQISEYLGEDRFAYHFRGTARSAGKRLLSISKPEGRRLPAANLEGRKLPACDLYQTGAYDLSLPPLSSANLDHSFILKKQAQTMRSVMPDIVEEIGQCEGRCYVRMAEFGGQSLRELMTTPVLPLDQFLMRIMIDVCNELKHLRSLGLQHHGNLKPETIIITGSGVKLISPGFLGPIETPEHKLIPLAITTAGYYPFMEPDDLLALGIILWEAVTRHHPLAVHGAELACRRAAPEYVAFIDEKMRQGHKHLEPVLCLPTPSELRPGVPSALESLMLRAMRLSFTAGGQLTLDRGFTSLSALRTALESL